MLEKLIIELGGIVPKDLMGAGLSEISSPSRSDLADNSAVIPSPRGSFQNE